ncbi:Dol-P-Man:Man(6)GlcNAc(2)-PP-Dol alpha-1,2-mannosyltransferase [Acorus calamus]|uniref:Mannosyltransferase n=1 Tax=Acorus calamus TaxID=4465 RepID=A0AAV9F9B1_ACOCL|nr:Dol-P-Man:Man(6)GlcNAc(2)-PP-Dol alpha-1,2-mannosyltransferase [Acorus calamus]
MSITTRQRRPIAPTSGDALPPRAPGRDRPRPSAQSSTWSEAAEEGGGSLDWKIPFVALAFLRYMSATSNIIHDCDETFNYWEPLHYLLYRSGFQTWEYSAEFALRSYLYLLFQALVAAPASFLFGDDKVRVFYAVRLFLGLISTASDTMLIVALSRRYGRRIASYTLAMLCLTSGCFFASTSFLPSSLSMYAVTLSSALFLLEKYGMAVSVAAAGVILGWPFSVLVALPITFYSLKRRFKEVFLAASMTSIVALILSVLTDHHYYGRWTSSVLNLLAYNVLGGGESHFYGTEGLFFYLRNGFNNFNLCFVLALLFLGILPIARKKFAPDLLIVVSPLYIWLVFMSLQPHKEERFLYPIYPLICIAAAAVIESFPDLFRRKYVTTDSPIVMAAKILRPLVLSLILCASHSRTFSLLNGYSAPLEIYKHLSFHEDAGEGSILCVGSEWHRFPSSFFVPSYISEVRWIDDGFRGLLPIPFNSTLGGTAAAPPYFNNKNMASEKQYLRDTEACTFLVELELKRPYPSHGSDLSKWEVLAAIHYLDRELSSPLYRSFFIPYMWQRNVFGLYKLLKRIPNPETTSQV